MILGTYRIQGNDFDQAGSASSGLKEQLKKLGADPDIIRRAMIAAYEAEMNVVIHAYQGTLRATLTNHQIDVEITDEGPGIPDIDLAMKEGFSTAPSKARELGFGAGMGLPNIKKNSDRFSIQSTMGQGTQLRFTIFLRPHEAFEPGHSSVHVVDGRCRECFHCLQTCPTKAIRVRKGKPQILDYLCIDCAACLRACRPGALAMLGTVGLPRLTEDTVLVIPPAFLVQFGPAVHPQRVLAGLYKLGFQEIRLTDAWEHALRSAAIAYGRDESNLFPTLSPVCPAVVNLIQMRFPSLINNLAPFLSPLEAGQEDLLLSRIPGLRSLPGRQIIYVTSCPSQYTALLAHGLAKRTDIITPATLRNAVQSLISPGGHPGDDIVKFPAPDPQEEKMVLQVTGIHRVLSILEKVENGLVTDLPVLELFACEGGCFGLPLINDDPFLARYRWRKACGRSRSWGRAVRRKEPFTPRSGVRLDTDMVKAIEKLAKIDKLTRTLPGKDCGICGAPTCAAMAEDITLGRSTIQGCIHIHSEGNDL